MSDLSNDPGWLACMASGSPTKTLLDGRQWKPLNDGTKMVRTVTGSYLGSALREIDRLYQARRSTRPIIYGVRADRSVEGFRAFI